MGMVRIEGYCGDENPILCQVERRFTIVFV